MDTHCFVQTEVIQVTLVLIEVKRKPVMEAESSGPPTLPKEDVFKGTGTLASTRKEQIKEAPLERSSNLQTLLKKINSGITAWNDRVIKSTIYCD